MLLFDLLARIADRQEPAPGADPAPSPELRRAAVAR